MNLLYVHGFVTSYICHLENIDWVIQIFQILTHFIIQYWKITFVTITTNLRPPIFPLVLQAPGGKEQEVPSPADSIRVRSGARPASGVLLGAPLFSSLPTTKDQKVGGARELPCPLSTMWGCDEKRAGCNPDEGSHQNLTVLAPWFWISSLQNCEK